MRLRIRALSLALLIAGCSSNDRVWEPGDTREGSGGEDSGPGAAGAPGDDPTECDSEDALRCHENLRERCARGQWVTLPSEEQCSGTMAVCSGAGVCAPYRLVSGGIDTLGARAAPKDQPFLLRDQSLSRNPRSCNAQYCVTGGIRP